MDEGERNRSISTDICTHQNQRNAWKLDRRVVSLVVYACCTSSSATSSNATPVLSQFLSSQTWSKPLRPPRLKCQHKRWWGFSFMLNQCVEPGQPLMDGSQWSLCTCDENMETKMVSVFSPLFILNQLSFKVILGSIVWSHLPYVLVLCMSQFVCKNNRKRLGSAYWLKIKANPTYPSGIYICTPTQ